MGRFWVGRQRTVYDGADAAAVDAEVRNKAAEYGFETGPSPSTATYSTGRYDLTIEWAVEEREAGSTLTLEYFADAGAVPILSLPFLLAILLSGTLALVSRGYLVDVTTALFLGPATVVPMVAFVVFAGPLLETTEMFRELTVRDLEGRVDSLELFHATYLGLFLVGVGPGCLLLLAGVLTRVPLSDVAPVGVALLVLLSVLASAAFYRLCVTDGFERWAPDVSQLASAFDSTPTTRIGKAHATFQYPPSVVYDKVEAFVEDRDPGFNPDYDPDAAETVLVGSRKTWATTVRYEWTVRPLHEASFAEYASMLDLSEAGPRGVLVTESVFVEDDFRMTFFSLPVSAAVLLLGFEGHLQSLPPTLQLSVLGAAVIFLFSAIATVVYTRLRIPSLLDPSDPNCYLERMRSSSTPLFTPILLVASVGFVGQILDNGVLYWTALLGLGVATLTAAPFYHRIVERYERSSVGAYTPGTITEYAGLMVGIAVVPLSLFLLHHVDPEAVETGQLAVLVISGGAFVVLALGLHAGEDRTQLLSLYRRNSRRYSQSPLHRWAALALAVGCAYAAVGLSVLAFVEFRPVAGRAAYAVFLPLLVPLAGFAYQSAALVTQLRYCFRVSEPASLDGVGEFDAQVRTYPGPVDGLVAYADGVRRVILVPEATVDLLTPAQLEAVLRHEEAHCAVYADSLLTTLSHVLGTLLLVGKNVLLVALDFHGREVRADRYAAERTDPTDLLLALDRIRDAAQDERSDADPRTLLDAATPVFPALRPTSLVSSSLGRFFGGFASTHSHPTFYERMDYLQDEG